MLPQHLRGNYKGFLFVIPDIGSLRWCFATGADARELEDRFNECVFLAGIHANNGSRVTVIKEAITRTESVCSLVEGVQRALESAEIVSDLNDPTLSSFIPVQSESDINVVSAARDDMRHFFGKAPNFTKASNPHTPFLVFSRGQNLVQIKFEENPRSLLDYPGDTLILAQWSGEFRSDYFQFKVDDLWNYIRDMNQHADLLGTENWQPLSVRSGSRWAGLM